MADLSQKEWSEQLLTDKDAVIVDVRTDEEMEEGHIPNAIQINIQNPGAFMEAVKELDASKNYYVYCRSGGRSAQACALFNSLGIKNVYNLEGGMEAWTGETAK